MTGKFGRLTAVWAMVLLVVSAAVGYTLNDRRYRAFLTTPASMLQAIVAPNPEGLFGKSAIRVLIVGLDYDYNDSDIESSKTSRSDIIMAVQLGLHDRRISELSVPRDMVAVMPNGQRAKINQAQSEGGIRESEAVVADWLGIPPFDRYVVLRIDATKDLIDALGGVDVDVENSDALRHAGPNGPIDYDDSWGHLHVHLKPGVQHLDGAHAVGYARFRHDWCSDPCRIMRQQQVIRALVDKVQHDRLDMLVHSKALLDVVHRDVETSFSPTEQLAILLAFDRLRPQDIRTAQVPYVASIQLPDYGDSIIPDEAKKRELVASMLLSPAEPGAAALPPALVHVTVLNGTKIAGLAGRYAADLRGKGFAIARVGDSPTSTGVTQIYGASEAAPSAIEVRDTIAPLVPSAALAPFPTDFLGGQNDVTIILGEDAAQSTQPRT